jgi:hypothetical protein
MFLVGLLQWWYGRGWISQVALFKSNLQKTSGFFSIGQLAMTLFAPFRQISVGQSGGSVSVQLQAFFDKTLSRCIGAIVRFSTIVFGIIFLSIRFVIEGIVLLLWFIIPALPIVGCILFAIGWVPVWM